MSDEERNDVQTENTQNTTQTNNNKSSFSQKAADAAKNIAKAVKKGGAKQTLLLPLAKIFVIVFLIILAIIIITGIFMFLVTMPGMVMDKLSAIFEEVGNYLAALFGADTTQMIESERVFETLDYIEDMGWELKGEGFLTDFIENESDIAEVNSEIKANLDEGYYIDEEQGVVRSDADSSILLAESDFIFTYIMSDNYIYTIKNENIVTQRENFEGFFGWIESVVSARAALLYKAYNALYGELFDLLGVTEATIDAFGKGMLVIYYGEPGEFGELKASNIYNSNSFFSEASVEMDTAAKKLIVKKNRSLFDFVTGVNGFTLEYSLDGWTGRYGMPLEFLLAIHKATLKPDLAYDMVTTFDTNVNLVLHDITGKVITGYKTDDSIVSYQQIVRATNTFAADDDINLWEELVNWMDKLQTTPEEAETMWKLGIDVIEDCETCQKKILYVIYNEAEAGIRHGEFLVRVPYGSYKIEEDSNDGDFLEADFYYTLDDNDYDEKGFWARLFGAEGDDEDEKGNGVYADGDTDKDGEIDQPYWDLPELAEDEKFCNPSKCYCIIDVEDDICSGCATCTIETIDGAEVKKCECNRNGRSKRKRILYRR